MEKKRVVITGIGVISPIGLTKSEFTDSIRSGKSGAGPVTLFDVSAYDTRFASEVKGFIPENYMDRKKVRRTDRFVQFALAAGKMAVEDSGIDFSKEDLTRIGSIIGSGIGGIWTIEKELRVLIEKGLGRVSPFFIPMEIVNMASGEIAITYGLRGPNYAVSSACASANNAIGDALRLMRYGDADVMVCGGSEAAISPIALAGFCSAQALSSRNDDPAKASRPFDKNRDGFVMGEGCGVIVLETLGHALKRNAKIYGELCGYGATDDAYHMTAPHPDAESACQAMRVAIADSGLTVNDIDYINAHGTSTSLNDKIETMAIKKVFGELAYKLKISSTKSMTGHLLGAAGAIELIATLISMENGFIHPTINYEEKDPDCDLDYVPNTAIQKQINCALSNSLGFGGHNAVLVIKRWQQ